MHDKALCMIQIHYKILDFKNKTEGWGTSSSNSVEQPICMSEI